MQPCHAAKVCTTAIFAPFTRRSGVSLRVAIRGARVPAAQRGCCTALMSPTTLLIAASLVLAGAAVAKPSSAAALDLGDFARLSRACAPHVALETAAAVARTESGFDTLAMHDNTTGRTFKPATRETAAALATKLVNVSRHSVDLGIMQINSANFAWLGMSIIDAFDPCRSLAAADQVLVAGYAAPAAAVDQQQALAQALSRYNTGSPARGIANGYVARIQASAEVIVPAIRLRGDGAAPSPAPLGGGVPVLVQPLPPPPASWDVYARARAAHGQQARPYAPGQPIRLQRMTDQQAVPNAR